MTNATNFQVGDTLSALGILNTTTKTLRNTSVPLWRANNAKAQKVGKRSTIYWVGKNLVGEDGTVTSRHGTTYQGEWLDNKKTGYGVQVYPSGDKFEGQWQEGLRHGEGTLWAPVGKAQKLRKIYVGGWRNDKRHGKGTCFFKSGQLFQGWWINGKMHGQGTLRYANGDLYIGEWLDGQRSGQGTLNKANGDCYEGFWLNDQREGSGSLFYASGKVFVGEWSGDLPRAGVYTQAQENPEQATCVPVTTTLPPVRLALPAEVLEGALRAVRRSRKAFRTKNVPLTTLFADQELESLRAAFKDLQKDDSISIIELEELCAQLGTEVPKTRLAAHLTDVGLSPEAQAVTFDDFCRVIALLLEDEANAPALDHTNPHHHLSRGLSGTSDSEAG